MNFFSLKYCRISYHNLKQSTTWQQRKQRKLLQKRRQPQRRNLQRRKKLRKGNRFKRAPKGAFFIFAFFCFCYYEILLQSPFSLSICLSCSASRLCFSSPRFLSSLKISDAIILAWRSTILSFARLAIFKSSIPLC